MGTGEPAYPDTGTAPQPTYSFNTSTNQITSSGYTYDAAGNMTSDGTHTYTYDAEGNITKVDGGATATYIYDALNHRVRTTIGSATTEFVFNQNGQRVSIWNGTAKTVERDQYYWGNTPIAFTDASATHFQHQDWLGTERLRTTYNGSVESSFTSLPFGDGYAASASDLDPYHYAQLDYDSETTTDSTEHAQFRQYSASEATWMRPDPFSGSYDLSNPQSFNRYAYALNNPIGLTDPLGLSTERYGNCLYDVEIATVDGQYDSTVYYLIGCYGDGGGGGGGGGGSGSGGGGGSASPAQNNHARAQCAAKNALSLASILGVPDSSFVGQAFLGNDISTVSNILFGTGDGPAMSMAQAIVSNPTPVNLMGATIGAVGATETGGLRIVQTAAQDVWGNPVFYAKGVSVAETALFKTASKALGVISAAKLAFDIAAYAEAYSACGGSDNE